MGKKILVQTECGEVSGNISDGFAEFKGIPFATAVRFGRPMPVKWTGCKDCTAFGKKAMQVIDDTMPWAKSQKREDFDEDCLNLNIYVPALSEDGLDLQADKKEEGLPVLIEVHGGAFQNGSNQEHTAKQMIRDNRFIYVALNYRLGVFGFLHIGALGGDNASGNLGLMDLMAGIQWIYENISAFGGDPQKMTLMGSSAGAKAIGALMCTPDLKKYVHQVILSSGATQSIRDKKTAGSIFEKYIDILCQVTGRESIDKDVLYNLPADTLIEAQKILCDNPGNTCMFGPVADGEFLPENWQELAVKGTLWEGRVMVGSSLHEMAFYKMMHPDFAKKAPQIAEFLFGTNAAIAREDFENYTEAYEKRFGCSLSEAQASDCWARILTDYMYRTYSFRMARRLAAKGCQVWQYSTEFLPALHCFDQSLAFGPLMPAFFDGEAHMDAAKVLGEKIYAAFVRFICSQNPSSPELDWPCLKTEAPVLMVWDEHSKVCPVKPEDVLEGIGESVFVL